MRCLALEKVFAENNVRFEYRENGEYTFYQDNPFFEKDDYSEEYKSQCKVKYEEIFKNRYLKWDYRFHNHVDDISDQDELYRWINRYNREHGYCCYVGEDNCLHITLHIILPEKEEADLEPCRAAWKMYSDMELMTLIVKNNEIGKPEPFTTHPLSEYDKAMMKKKREKYFKAIPMPSPEENITDICQQLKNELNELKMSRAVGEIEPAAAEEKIREIEDLLKLMDQ